MQRPARTSMTPSQSSVPPALAAKVKIEEDIDDDVQVISPGSFALATSANRGRQKLREQRALGAEYGNAAEDVLEPHLRPIPDLLSGLAVRGCPPVSFASQGQSTPTEATVVASSSSRQLKFADWRQSTRTESVGARTESVGSRNNSAPAEDPLELTLSTASCRVDATIEASPRSTRAGFFGQEQSRKRNAEPLSRSRLRLPALSEKADTACPGNASLAFPCLPSTATTGRNAASEPVRREINPSRSFKGDPKTAVPCPICKGPRREESSTICGHAFCKRCIINSILLIKRCPICQLSLTVDDVHPVHTD